MRTIQRGSIFIAALIVHADASAEICSPPTPTCHLEAGKQLIATDPKRASEELLASYKLDERTETLVLYAQALERDKRYALAVDTWQRIATYRESELVSAKESRSRTAIDTAKRRLAQATGAMAKLAPMTARVRIKLAPGPKPMVTRDGVDVDITHEIVVNAGGDELVFTRKDGAVERVKLALTAGENVRIDAPAFAAIADKPKAEPKRAPIRRIDTKPAQTEVAVTKPEPKAEPKLLPKAVEPKPAPTKLDRALATRTEPRSKTMSRVGLGVMAGGIAAGALAGTFGYLWYRDFDRAKDLGCSGNGECPIGEATDLAERSNDRARIAQVSAIGAGALLATGATLYVLGNRKVKREAPAMTLTVSPSSATFAWRF